MNNSKTKCVKTWKWALSDKPCPLPKNVNPRWFRCGPCGGDSFARYEYNGQTLFLCMNCGQVYNLVPKEGRYDLETWDVLWRQPYYWKYIDRWPGKVAFDLIHFSGDIKMQPIVEAHCKDDVYDAAEMIVRYLIRLKDSYREYFFFNETKKMNVTSSSEELVVADGKTDGKFPRDRFDVLREDRDHITYECNELEESNIYGFTADLNEEDWETIAHYTSLKITFLSENKGDLPENSEVLDYIPKVEGRFVKKRWIIKDPFGLEGYFLFEICKNSLFLGVGYSFRFL